MSRVISFGDLIVPLNK